MNPSGRWLALQWVLPALLLMPVTVAVAAPGIAITGGTVHTLTDAGTLEGAVILIRDGRIEDVGTGLDVPGDYEVVDAAGKVVTPGLIESYSRLGISEIGGEQSTVDAQILEYPAGASFDVRYALNPDSVALAVNRRDGVTRAVVAPLPGNDPFAGSGVVIRLGGEPMLVRPEVALFASIGTVSAEFVGGSRSAVIQRLRRGLSLAPRYSPDRYRPGPGDYSHADLAALQRFLRAGTPLAVTVNRANEIRETVALASDFELSLVVIGGAEAWKVAAELAEAEVPVVVHVEDNLPSSYDQLGARLDNAALLHQAGVTVLLTSGESENIRKIRQMAGIAAAQGMPWEAALSAMTRAPAEVWGLEPGCGTLTPGAPADLVVWSGDPLELTEWAEQVMVDGRWQDMRSRQTELFERYRELGSDDFYYRR